MLTIDRTPLAYEFVPPLPGERELESVKLALQIDRFERNAAERAERGKQAGLIAWAVLAVLIPVFIFAAVTGLARQEQAYQQEARV